MRRYLGSASAAEGEADVVEGAALHSTHMLVLARRTQVGHDLRAVVQLQQLTSNVTQQSNETCLKILPTLNAGLSTHFFHVYLQYITTTLDAVALCNSPLAPSCTLLFDENDQAQV